jgi:hypothetical protein
LTREEAARATWARLQPIAEPAFAKAGLPVDQVREEVQQGRWQLWPGESCLLVTAGATPVLQAGDIEEAKAFVPACLARAKALFEPTDICRIIHLFDEALAECCGTHTRGDLLDAFVKGTAHAWHGERCAVATEFQDHPRRRQLNIWLAAGSLREMQAMRPGMEAFARAHGATEIHFGARLSRHGRRRLSGWTRASGYEARWLHHYKEIVP